MQIPIILFLNTYVIKKIKPDNPQLLPGYLAFSDILYPVADSVFGRIFGRLISGKFYYFLPLLWHIRRGCRQNAGCSIWQIIFLSFILKNSLFLLKQESWFYYSLCPSLTLSIWSSENHKYKKTFSSNFS